MKVWRRFLSVLLILGCLSALAPVFAADCEDNRNCQVDWRFVSPKPKGPDDPADFITLPAEVSLQQAGGFGWFVNCLLCRLLGLPVWW
jgi:hypothetical protein